MTTQPREPLTLIDYFLIPSMIVLFVGTMWVGGSWMIGVTHGAPSHCEVGRTASHRKFLPDAIQRGELYRITRWPVSAEFDKRFLIFRRDYDRFCREAFGLDAEAYQQFSGAQ